MAEWHVPPDYIVNNWTQELLSLMIEKLAERKRMEQGLADINPRSGDRIVSDETLFKTLGSKLRRRHGN